MQGVAWRGAARRGVTGVTGVASLVWRGAAWHVAWRCMACACARVRACVRACVRELRACVHAAHTVCFVPYPHLFQWRCIVIDTDGAWPVSAVRVCMCVRMGACAHARLRACLHVCMCVRARMPLCCAVHGLCGGARAPLFIYLAIGIIWTASTFTIPQIRFYVASSWKPGCENSLFLQERVVGGPAHA